MEVFSEKYFLQRNEAFLHIFVPIFAVLWALERNNTLKIINSSLLFQLILAT